MRSPTLQRRALLGLLALLPFGRAGAKAAAPVATVDVTPAGAVVSVQDDLIERWVEWKASRQIHGQPPRAAGSEA